MLKLTRGMIFGGIPLKQRDILTCDKISQVAIVVSIKHLLQCWGMYFVHDFVLFTVSLISASALLGKCQIYI